MSGVVYVEEGDAIHGNGKAVIVGDGVGLSEEVRDEVWWKGRKSKVPHVVVGAGGEVGEDGCVVCESKCVMRVPQVLYSIDCM